VRKSLFEPTVEGEARLLLLIHAFTGPSRGLEGRTKLAKLDFFLRYPEYMQKAMTLRGADVQVDFAHSGPIEKAMVRYRYGPWDPAYFAILGRLQGKGLIETRPGGHGALTYRSSNDGGRIAEILGGTEAWCPVASDARLLRRHLDLTGTNLKEFVYAHFPEVTKAKWGEAL